MSYPLNGNTYVVSAVTSTTITLTFADTTGYPYVSGGTVDYGATVYGTLPVGTEVTLSAVVETFVAGHVGAIFRLSEDGHGTGIQNAPVGDETASIESGQVYTNEGNVYGIRNVTGLSSWEKITRVPAHESGTVRVYAEGNLTTYFDADFLHPSYSIVRITGYTSPTVVSAEVVRYQLPLSVISNGTIFWEEGAWSAHRGYPRAISLFEQRLWLGGSISEPSVIWSSRSGSNFEHFGDGTKDNHAIVYRMASGSSDVIRWLMAGRVLTAGTSMGEYAIAASSQQEALTPSNVRAVLQTGYGTSSAQPIRINQSIFYPQRSGKLTNPARKLRKFGYDIQADAYKSDDVSIFSEHVLSGGFDRIAYQTEPDSIVWNRRSDGQLAGFTFEEAQDVGAWHRHRIGGTAAEVKALCVIPGDDGDDLWLSVKRTVNGSITRSIEVLSRVFRDDDAKQDGIYLDSAVVYSGSPTSTISGLNHLEGETVTILNNGSVELDKVVHAGVVSVDVPTTYAVIGLPYTAIIETEDLEGGNRTGTSQSRAKKISQVYMRLHRSLGGSAGGYVMSSTGDQTLIPLRPIHYRQPANPMDTSPPLFSGFKVIDLNLGFNREAVVRIEHSDPFPFFVTGIVAELDASG